MKNLGWVFAALLLAGCAQPQYTVMGAQPQTTTTTMQAASWPELSDWEAGDAGVNDVAVIVAIEDYAFLPDVSGAIQNANDWEQYFRVHRGTDKVYTLTNTQATAEEILRFAKQAASEASADGKVWFIFIGHGAPTKDGSDGALITMDAQQTINSIQSRSIKRGDLVASLETGPQAQTVVILDTCFSGKDPSGELLAAGTQPVIPVQPTLASVAQGTVVLSAAASNEVAGQLPGTKRPAFSYLLLGALSGWATTSEDVKADVAVNYVKSQFRHLKGRQQTPGIEGNKGIVLASNAKNTDPGVAALMKGEGTQTVTVTGPASVAGEKWIDTNQGLIFVEPKGWGIGPAGMGIVLTMRSMVGGSEIAVERYETSRGNAAMYFSNFHEQPGFHGWRVIQKPSTVTFGTTDGAVSHYVDPDPDLGGQIHIFETYQSGAAWRFRMRIPDADYEAKHVEEFRSFVGKVRFKTVGQKQASSWSHPTMPSVAPAEASDDSKAAQKMQSKVFNLFFDAATRGK